MDLSDVNLFLKFPSIEQTKKPNQLSFVIKNHNFLFWLRNVIRIEIIVLKKIEFNLTDSKFRRKNRSFYLWTSRKSLFFSPYLVQTSIWQCNTLPYMVCGSIQHKGGTNKNMSHNFSYTYPSQIQKAALDHSHIQDFPQVDTRESPLYFANFPPPPPKKKPWKKSREIWFTNVDTILGQCCKITFYKFCT